MVGGVPVFKGTRGNVKTFFDYLEESSMDEFLQGHPLVSRKQTEVVIELAAKKLLTEISSEKYFLMKILLSG